MARSKILLRHLATLTCNTCQIAGTGARAAASLASPCGSRSRPNLEIIQWLDGGGPTARRVFETILEKEEEHADNLLNMLEKTG